jgi:hypothetical protein
MLPKGFWAITRSKKGHLEQIFTSESTKGTIPVDILVLEF